MRLIGFQKQKRNGGKEIIKEIIRKSLITEGHECPDWQNLLNAQHNVGKKTKNKKPKLLWHIIMKFLNTRDKKKIKKSW